MNQSSIQLHFPKQKSTIRRYHADEELSMKKTIKQPLPSFSTKLKSLLTPIAKIPSLSKTTLTVIDSLNMQKSSSSVEQILASLPAKEKYADLLEPISGFPLPYAHKKLLKSLELIDKALNYCAMIKQPSYLSSIIEFIQNKCRFSFALESLQQIMRVFDAYSIEWTVKSDKECVLLVRFNKKYELIEGQLGNEVIAKRKLELSTRLLKIVQDEYKKFLDQRGIKDPGNAWHWEFNLQAVPEIDPLPLPPKGEPVKSIVNSEIVGRNALIDAVFKEMQEEKTESVKEVREEIQVQARGSHQKSSGKKDRILGMCEYLKGLFLSSKMPSIFYANLVKKLNGSRFENDLKDDLLIICAMFPQWLSIVETNSGSVIRCNRQYILTLKTINEEINKVIID